MSPKRPTYDFLRNLPDPEEPRFWKMPGGARLAWNEYGDPDGEPVMYYHGWPSSRWQARLAHHLARERRLRVISMDRPGVGRSDLVPGRRLEDWPELMRRFADELGIRRFAQLGVSGGGPYVLSCAALIPDRVVASCVLCGAVSFCNKQKGMRGLHPVYRMMASIRKLPPGIFSIIFKIASRVARRGAERLPLSLLIATLPKEDRKVLMENPDAMPVFIQSFCEGVRQGGRGIMSDADIYLHEWSFKLHDIQSEIHYWHGGEDRNIPLFRVREFINRIPAAHFHEERDLGHFSLAIHMAPIAMDYLTEKLRNDSSDGRHPTNKSARATGIEG